VIGSPVRDPISDHLLTPQNAALCVIDYQPSQFAGVRSIDHDLLLENIVSTVRIAKAFGLPIVHSTINVAMGRGQPTVPEVAELLADDPPADRTTTNAWEDPEFLAAVRATGRRKLILCALWTEICMAFPALDALREGYDVYSVVDAIGGTSEEAHRAGIQTRRPGRRAADRLGLARGRAPARLGTRGNRERRDRDRAHR
jgi:nicotinamidase-related amidase